MVVEINHDHIHEIHAQDQSLKIVIITRTCDSNWHLKTAASFFVQSLHNYKLVFMEILFAKTSQQTALC